MKHMKKKLSLKHGTRSIHLISNEMRLVQFTTHLYRTAMTSDFLELRRKVITKKTQRQRRHVLAKPFTVLGVTPESATDDLLSYKKHPELEF